MKVLNQTQKTVLATRADVADTPWSRLVGLLGRKTLAPGAGLIITDTRSIHMVGMRFAIDAVFADKKGRVVGVVKNIRPFRFSLYYWQAAYVVELPAGTVASSCTEKGDLLELVGGPG